MQNPVLRRAQGIERIAAGLELGAVLGTVIVGVVVTRIGAERQLVAGEQVVVVGIRQVVDDEIVRRIDDGATVDDRSMAPAGQPVIGKHRITGGTGGGTVIETQVGEQSGFVANQAVVQVVGDFRRAAHITPHAQLVDHTIERRITKLRSELAVARVHRLQEGVDFGNFYTVYI